MRRHPRLVGFFWRWHRRIGLTAAILALVLAVTGIALNHSPDLSLDQRFVKGSWVYGLYGDDTQQLPAYRAGEHWLYRSAAGQVYLDSAELAPCQGELTGALELAGLFYIACTDELLLATSAGELVEAITASTGLPAPVNRARICPSPAVVISSAMVEAGSSRSNSGSPRTLLWCRPKPPGLPVLIVSRAGRVNSEPPSLSRLPVAILTTWVSHWFRAP